MLNFTFCNPVKILFGKGQIANIASEIPADARICMTYGGGSIKTNGVYEQVQAALQGREVVEFGGIEPNPHYETLMQAVDLVRERACTFLLAVGGGSVLDGTKFIAAAVPCPGDPWDIVCGNASVTGALPLGSVLTLPATGSEMNTNAVITRWETREKRAFSSSALFPRFSVLDPETTFSLSLRQISNGIVDAFVHVLEQYLTYPVYAPLQDRLAEAVLLTLIEEAPNVLARLKDYDARANIMWCATMALNGLIGAGVPQDWTTHTIGHELTALHTIDHARTLAIVLPSVLTIRREAKREKLLQYAERVWGLTTGDPDERITEAIHQTRHFFESLGLETRLFDYGLGPETIKRVVERFEQRGWTGLGERQDITPAVVHDILTLSL
jgi:NADP-dependent alcohol dehydrogenase